MSIKKCREKAGKSVQEVADHLGVSDVAAYAWEKGEYVPKPDKLLKLAKFLWCTVEELLEKEDEK